MPIPLQNPAFDPALVRYLEDTVRSERRRRRFARFRLAALLTAALLICQLPYVDSHAADATAPRLDRVAAFARPELAAVIAQAAPELDLRRLAFASMGVLVATQGQEPPVTIAAATAAAQ